MTIRSPGRSAKSDASTSAGVTPCPRAASARSRARDCTPFAASAKTAARAVEVLEEPGEPEMVVLEQEVGNHRLTPDADARPELSFGEQGAPASSGTAGPARRRSRASPRVAEDAEGAPDHDGHLRIGHVEPFVQHASRHQRSELAAPEAVERKTGFSLATAVHHSWKGLAGPDTLHEVSVRVGARSSIWD